MSFLPHLAAAQCSEDRENRLKALGAPHHGWIFAHAVKATGGNPPMP
jgi:hypothetical protein